MREAQVVDEWTTDGTMHELKGILKAGGMLLLIGILLIIRRGEE